MPRSTRLQVIPLKKRFKEADARSQANRQLKVFQKRAKGSKPPSLKT